MWRFITGVGSRLGEWWTRSVWGWLVVIGPMLSYLFLLISLDVIGLGSSDPLEYLPANPQEAFLPAEKMTLYSVAGRLEYAIASSVFFLVACFSIIWSVPRIFFSFRNPFGGLTGLILSIGSSAALYYLYFISDYNLRQVFADDLLVYGEENGLIPSIYSNFNVLGIPIMAGELTQSQIMSMTRDVVYLVGNAAPWCLIVLAAKCAAYEPRKFREESPESLRSRIIVLQIAVVLAAANIVLSIAYTRAMVSWPPMLLEPEVAKSYIAATSRYTALWGALGTILLATALAPAVVSVNRQLDRVASRELGANRGRHVSFEERMIWRRKHGLLVSAQQALTTGAAVVAPVMTSPTLDATHGGSGQNQEIRPPGQELPFDQR
ncbi:MAG: hypothetical protein KTR21_05795 [Rhodobacteraceae bacterium]|nr:hypothetical protein [Paracoccaceae bacterium]